MMKRFSIPLLCFSMFGVLRAGVVYEQPLRGESLQIGTMLSWSTASEENNALFVVEKSSDGVEFINIGSVEGAGNSAELREYTYLDIMATGERNYYRLKQVDDDGSFSYSEVVLVLQEYPNDFIVARMSAVATPDLFQVTVDALKNGELTYRLTNWQQETLLEDKLLVVNGLNDLTVDLSDKKPGIYKLFLKMDREEEVLTIQKVLDEIQRKPNVATKNEGLKGKN